MSRIPVHLVLEVLKRADIACHYVGRTDVTFSRLSAIDCITRECISFYRGLNKDVLTRLESTTNLVFLKKTLAGTVESSANLAFVENPDVAFCIVGKFFSENKVPGIHSSAKVGEGAVLGKEVTIGPNVVIGQDVVIGDRVRIDAGAVLDNCTIGSGSHIYPGVKVGSAGLGSHRHPNGEWVHFPHVARVNIGDNVTIQDNTVIARGTLSDTVLKDGVTIGPQVAIAHGVQLGRNVLISQSTILAGSVIVGENAIIWGNVSVRDGVVLGNRCVVGLGSVVLKDVLDDDIVVGNPARSLQS